MKPERWALIGGRSVVADWLIIAVARVVGGREHYRRLSEVWTLGLAAREELADPTDLVQPPARLINYGALLIPARMLAECKAKRQLLELHHADEGLWDGFCVSCGNDTGPDLFPCETILTLAAVHADHPDYQQAWSE